MKRAVTTKQEVFDALNRNNVRLQALGVRRLGLFGSFVRGDQRPGSDVDIVVEFQPGKKTFGSAGRDVVNFVDLLHLTTIFQR